MCRNRSRPARRRTVVDSEIEVRQIYSAEDFGDALTPELREQEERLRKEMQSDLSLATVAAGATTRPGRHGG
jgi:hypothetical protein